MVQPCPVGTGQELLPVRRLFFFAKVFSLCITKLEFAMPQVAAISQQIWDMKYRLKGPDGAPVDKTIEDTWRRVAEALAEAEPEPRRAEMVARFSAAMEDFKFLPAGRIIAGAGAKRSVTLFNCFVMGTVPDDMSGIFEHLREAALTRVEGGGIGYDFSPLRPKGAPVKGWRGRVCGVDGPVLSPSWMSGTRCAGPSCRPVTASRRKWRPRGER